MSNERGSSKKYFVRIVVIAVILIILFAPIIPYTYTDYVQQEVTKQHTETLINERPTVSAGYYLYYRVHVDVSNKQNNVIDGRVVETAGYDINFYVFDQKNFNLWKNRERAAAYVSVKKVNSYQFSFVPDHSDYYYFVLDNTYSLFTNKVPEITATWKYVTTEIQNVPVQKTKYVSLFQILTGQV